MRIDINLASQPYQDSREFWGRWGSALTVLGVITAALLYFTITGFISAQHDREQMAKLQSELAVYQRQKTQAEALLNQPQNRTLRDESRFLNGLFEQKSFSWTRVFEDLERVMPAHLHVVSIHPDLASENNLELKLVVGGESREQALDLVRKMEGSNHFKDTRINSEKVAEQTSPSERSDPVQFEIEASYVPSPLEKETSGGMH